MEMDWAELNPDLLHHIARKVGDISNFIRLRAVCKHWLSTVHPSELPPQPPCFLLNRPATSTLSQIQFFSLHSNRTHTRPHSLPRRVYFQGSSSGYILLGERTGILSVGSLINPITGFQLPLPFGDVINYHLLYVGPSRTANSIPIANSIDVLINTASTMDNTTDYVTSLWRYSEEKWTVIFEKPYVRSEMIFYLNGKLYIYNILSGETRIVDVTTGNVVSVVPGPSEKFRYLIEACGDILGVRFYHLKSRTTLTMYRLEGSGTKSRWAKLNGGIGDWILFLHYHFGFCLKASDFDGFRGNCIYFVDSTPICDCNNRTVTNCNCCTELSIARYDLECTHNRCLVPGSLVVHGLCLVFVRCYALMIGGQI